MRKIIIGISLLVLSLHSTSSAQNATPVGPMVTYEVTDPNGKTYNMETPVGTPLADLKHAVLAKTVKDGLAIKKTPPDMSQLSTADLEALAAGDVVRVSTQGLQYLSGGAPPGGPGVELKVSVTQPPSKKLHLKILI